MIKTVNLCKRVDLADSQLTILDSVNLDIKAGESVAIVGPSGSGKSTLLGLLAGLDSPSEGEVFLAEEPMSAMSEDERAALRGRTVGFVFQSFQLLPGLTALENVMLPLELAGKTNVVSTAKSFLERVGLEARLKHYPRQLSGGEQQRVALARAFAAQPKVLFADEPTGNLDSDTGNKINEILFSLNAESNTTLVLVTHEHGLAERCQRRLSIAGGKLVKDSAAETSAS